MSNITNVMVCFFLFLQNKINHSVIKDLLDPIKELYEDVRRKALMRLEYEGLHKSEAITTPGARFHNDPAGFAMNRYAYYVCYKCKKVLWNQVLVQPLEFALNVSAWKLTVCLNLRLILEGRRVVMQKQVREMIMTPVSWSVARVLMSPGLRWVKPCIERSDND